MSTILTFTYSSKKFNKSQQQESAGSCQVRQSQKGEKTKCFW